VHAARLRSGFSLIELLVVLAIMGVMGTIVFPLAEMTVQRDRERELKRALWEIRDAIDAYKKATDNGTIAINKDLETGYPPTLTALVEGVDTTKGHKLVLLRRMPRDPFAAPGIPAEQTWGLRSYYSPAAEPAAGKDVYDVFSLSNKTGLNGIPLKDW
jgi:general secretion pathway protein G